MTRNGVVIPPEGNEEVFEQAIQLQDEFDGLGYRIRAKMLSKLTNYGYNEARKYVKKAIKLSEASRRSWKKYAWIFNIGHTAVVNGVAVFISYDYTKLLAFDQAGFTFREKRYDESYFKLAGVLRSIAAGKFKPETVWTDLNADKQFKKLLEGFPGVEDFTPVLSNIPPVAKKVVAALV